MTDLRTAAQQALETCPFCGNEPHFSGNASIWQDEARYVELSLGCCVSMTEQIRWRRARDMTHEAKTAELQNRLRLKWNARAALEQPEPEQEPLAIATVDESLGVVFKFSRSHTLLPGQMLYVYTHPPRREQEQEPVDAEAALRFALAQRDWAFKQLQAQPDRREWRGLSQEERADILFPLTAAGASDMECSRAIEQALKEKNHE